MKILLVSSEATPFAKTGGLADVCGALPRKLASLGHQVTLVIPAYRQAKKAGMPLEPVGRPFDVPIGGKVVSARLLRSHLPDSNVPVLLVEQDAYFDRNELYQEGGRDYHDNCERFVFFCRAALEAIRVLQLPVDLIHCNDWQSGLIPAYLKLAYHKTPGYEHLASLLTLHNLAYQGSFWHWDMLLTGLDWRHFNWKEMEFYGHLNLLKTGIVFADSLNTVSPRYAEEIQHEPWGCGLETVLRHRKDVLSGIINGVDYSIWNPTTDPHLAANYDVANWQQSKAACKSALRAELGLPERDDAPLLGLIGRLVDQKGWDLVAQAMQRWLEVSPAQWVILGTGDPTYQSLLTRLARQWPTKLAARFEFSDRLAHRIEAGCDLFVMPSRYEPCGLNQFYSLRYGSVPVVHATGGLADTITDATAEALAAGNANGFTFTRYDVVALDDALSRAGNAWRHHPDLWQRLVETGMKQDWSWRNSARQYVSLYEKTIELRRSTREPEPGLFV